MIVELFERDIVSVLDNTYSIGSIYREAFSAPPYSTSAHVAYNFTSQTLPTHAQRPGFRCFVARDVENDKLVGFTYGYQGAPGQWWRDIVAGALSPSDAAHWMDDYFEFVELAVIPSAQGQGIGGRLHDTILASVPQPRALLSTHATENTARQIYERRGWVALRDNFLFPGSTKPFVIMGWERGSA